MREDGKIVNATYSTNSKVVVVALVVGGAAPIVVLKFAVVVAVVVAVKVLSGGRNAIHIDDKISL